MNDSAPERRRLAGLLARQGGSHPPVAAGCRGVRATRAVPQPWRVSRRGKGLAADHPRGTTREEWLRLAYSAETLTTQLDGHLTADQCGGPVTGVPTSSSTDPTTVAGMIESLDLDAGHRVLEIGTGTGYSTALMCHYLGEDNVTTVEVDPEVAARADAALEAAGFSTWTVTGDGLLGHPAGRRSTG